MFAGKVDADKMAEMKGMLKEEDDDEEYKTSDKPQQSSLNDKIMEQKAEQENTEFPYVLLHESERPSLWQELATFFGINADKFPGHQLAYQKDTNKNIILLNEGLSELMNYRRKNKLKVVNIGLKIFCKNKGN